MLQRIKNSQEWNAAMGGAPITLNDLLELRLQCYRDIEKLRGRPLLVYAANIYSQAGNLTSIEMTDVDGFTDLANSVKNKNEVDVLIHSPGGRADVTERLVCILRNNFEKVHFLVPHSAYSAATMMALSGDSITLHPSATLGPIDPQIQGIPARSIIRGFDKVKSKIKEEGPESLPAYIPLIEKYSLDLLEVCEDSEKLSKELVYTWLSTYMFKDGEVGSSSIEDIVNYFSDYDTHLMHSRAILFDKIKNYGLNIEQSTGQLTELLWEAYTNITGFFGVSAFVKVYENAYGISYGKIFNPPPPQTPVTSSGS